MDYSRKTLLVQNDCEDDDLDFSDETKIIRMVNRALNGAAHLNNLLPTGTMLTFQVLCPIFSNGGQCDLLHELLTAGLLAFCGLSTFLLSFTDSIREPDGGKIYYGIATPRGLWTFGSRKGSALDTSRLRLKFLDFVHAFLSVLVLLSLGVANYDVVDCFYPEMPRVYMNTVPIVTGFVISKAVCFVSNYPAGIGHPVMFHRESMFGI